MLESDDATLQAAISAFTESCKSYLPSCKGLIDAAGQAAGQMIADMTAAAVPPKAVAADSALKAALRSFQQALVLVGGDVAAGNVLAENADLETLAAAVKTLSSARVAIVAAVVTS